MADSKGLGFVAGFLIGGLVGAAATIAFGPELDEETRRRLKDESLHWRGQIGEISGRARVEAGGLVDRGRTILDEQRARFQEAVSESKEAAADTEREMRSKFDQAEREGEAPL